MEYLAQSHIELSPTRAYPTIRYEVYWGIRQVSDALLKTCAAWILTNGIIWPISMYNDWPIIIPSAWSVISPALFLRLFGQVPDWHNRIDREPPAQSQPAPEPEDERQFAGWATETRTKTTLHIDWYTPPVPFRQAQSFALALVNNRFEWVDERDLETHKANISGPNYRELRKDWIRREWVEEKGKRTAIISRSMIRRFAFEEPE